MTTEEYQCLKEILSGTPWEVRDKLKEFVKNHEPKEVPPTKEYFRKTTEYPEYSGPTVF